MPPPEANGPGRTTEHEANPRPAAPDATADAVPRDLPDNAVTAAYVPGRATEPAATRPDGAHRLISVPGYEIEAVLGRGGMGVVYKARHLALKRTVALKMVLAGGHASPSELARFRIEAEAVARLQHPNIVQIHEVGEADGHPYCALEFVEGSNLASKIDGKPLPAPESARLVEALARAMQLAHSRNVVHRDLKPANILLASPGRASASPGRESGEWIPKITDFGLARQLDSDSGETQSGAVVGTPSYMAPEQASGRAHEAGPAADVYALGAILYNCLAGCPPFKGNSVVETLDQVRTQEPVPPSRVARSGDRATTVPLDLETICLKCLRKEPEKRYASAAELADDLVRYQRGEAIQARPVGQLERALKWVKRNPLLSLALATLLLVTTLGVAGIVWKYLDAEHQKGIAEEKREEAEKQTAIAKKNEDDAKRQLSNSTFLLAVAAYDNRDVPLARQRLASIEADYRGWEWYYFRRQSSGGIFTLYGHTSHVDSVAFSPDGKRIVTGSHDRTVKVWDARTGTLLMVLEGFQEAVLSVAFSPDGTRIITGSADSTAKVWDARTGTPLLEMKGHTNGVSSVAYSPDGTRLVTGGGDKTAKVWDARTATLLLELKGHSGGVRSVAFSPDGVRIATGSWDNTVRLWDARNGTPLGELKDGNGIALCLAFSPDGTRIVIGTSDTTAQVWTARTGTPPFELGTPPLELKGHTGGVWSVAFSPDGTRIVTGSGDKTAKVWDARTGSPLLDLKGHTGGVASLAFSPDSTLIVTGSVDNTAKVWDTRVATAQIELKGHTGGVWSAAFNRDGTRVVTGSWDRTAKVWDAWTGAPQLELKGHTSFVRSVAFSPDGSRIATGSLDNTAKIWDANTGTPLLELKGHADGVRSVVFSPDGTRILTGSQDKTARVWDAETGMSLLELQGHTGELHGVAFSPDGTRIVTASEDQTARLWDAHTGTPLLELKGHTGPVYCVAFSPDGTRIVTGSDDKTAKVWDARTARPLLELKGHTGPVYGVAFSPDGMRIVTGSPDKTARVWDAQTGTPMLELKGHTDSVRCVAFSRDGTRIVTASWDQTAKVWDAPMGTTLLELKGRTSDVLSAALTPDGTRIVTTSRDQTSRVWDARTGRELKGEPIPQTIANSETSPDGRFFAHVDGNCVEVLPLRPDAEELAHRRLHTQPSLERYREGYEAAQATEDDFATRFYLNLLPPAEQKMLTLEAAAERDIAAGRTQDALVPLVAMSAANPEDTILSLKVAALQAWFGQEKEYADTCARALEFARGTSVLATAERAAKVCCLRPSTTAANAKPPWLSLAKR